MTLPVPALLQNATFHARTRGFVTVGAGDGEVPAIGLNQLMTLDVGCFFLSLNSDAGNAGYQRFRDRIKIICKSHDGNITDVRYDAVQFAPATGRPVKVRLRVDITATSADLELLIEDHHSIGA